MRNIFKCAIMLALVATKPCHAADTAVPAVVSENATPDITFGTTKIDVVSENATPDITFGTTAPDVVSENATLNSAALSPPMLGGDPATWAPTVDATGKLSFAASVDSPEPTSDFASPVPMAMMLRGAPETSATPIDMVKRGPAPTKTKAVATKTNSVAKTNAVVTKTNPSANASAMGTAMRATPTKTNAVAKTNAVVTKTNPSAMGTAMRATPTKITTNAVVTKITPAVSKTNASVNASAMGTAMRAAPMKTTMPIPKINPAQNKK